MHCNESEHETLSCHPLQHHLTFHLSYANKKVQVFSFLPDATAWLVVLYVQSKSYLGPRKISSEKKDFFFSIFKTFSFSICLAFVMSKVIFCQTS